MNYRTKISKILVKWHMPTRQAAISEIMLLMRSFIRESCGEMESVGEIIPIMKYPHEAQMQLGRAFRNEFREKIISRSEELLK